MLSYRHSFHAGNFADLIKHIVVVEIFEHLLNKDKPFDYIDTHAGAGLFDLSSADAGKLMEYAGGIGRLDAQAFPELSGYFEVINACNRSAVFDPASLHYYPGSPSIAKYFLRRKDRAWLYELHPQDYTSLINNMAANNNIRVFCEDGLKGLTALLPPVSRRAFVLIDPSYEVKAEYDQVVVALEDACRRFATGTYALWYPVVERSKVDRLQARLIKTGIRHIQRFELAVAADNNARGMTAAGMLVINPPWTLFDKMAAILPRLAQRVGGNEQLFHCEVLVPE